MDQIKKMQVLGIIFLICGSTFLAVGLATQMPALWALGPALLTLGIVFLATSRVRSKRNAA